ncbi:MAG: SIS domain-containing protein [Gammaproteobacteria bacterium]|nr:SIS domain-containing protein [Gammaproteobacteria bacterium]MDE0510142.1 SIS domain-containing protein [Gammaproteobacteria bacterium]
MPVRRLTPSASRMFQETGEIAENAGRQQTRNAVPAGQIAEKLKRIAPKFILTCARGSSDHAATYAKYLFETQMGLAVCSFAPSVASLYAAQTDFREAVFISISQSGRSPDLLSASRAAKAGGAYVVAVVNDEASPLAGLADDVLPIGAGPELSVAATKSCIGAMSALYHLCAEWRGEDRMRSALATLPETLAQAWSLDWPEAVAPLCGARQAVILSRGIGLAGAQEAALKLKETCMIQAEGFSAAEVRHGPMTIVGEGFPVIAIATFDASQESIDSVSREFLRSGAWVLVAGKPVDGASCLPTPRAPDSNLQPLVFLQAFYKFANALSFDRGLDPDNPRNLSKVTKTV